MGAWYSDGSGFDPFEQGFWAYISSVTQNYVEPKYWMAMPGAAGMHISTCEQGSREWVELRLGKVTASEISRIVTATGRLSASRQPYMAELLVEYITGEPVKDWGGNEDTERGHRIEPQARAFYEAFRGEEVTEVGFVQPYEGAPLGCSPDGLVGDDGGLEAKAPNPETHLLWLSGGIIPVKHMPQVQFCLYVTGRKWWDWMTYSSRYPELIVRAYPHPAYFDTIDKHLPTFLGEIADRKRALYEMGVKPE